MKKHTFFIIVFISATMIFFWKIICLKSAFLGGDYIDQFYPWSLIYSNSIKNLTFPYWTRFVQGGYPLMAEGQIGGFYPFNILFFFILPFKLAYNYITVFHFFLAGIFTYMFSRKLGACKWGGTLAALLFCFGSAYAGCYINTATVKVLTWVPLVLLIFEMYFNSRKMFLPFIGGIVFGAQLLAGSTQVAVYTGGFYFVYFLYGIYQRKDMRKTDFLNLLVMFFISGIIFLPQFFLTKTIAELSWRKNATMGFALWGSFSPVSFISSVIPYPFFRGARFYLSIFSLAFMILGIFRARKEKVLRPVVAVFFISIFCALGKYNPLYVLILKLTHFYDFRNPSKFLLFGLFAGSVLCGRGFTCFFRQKDEKGEDHVRKALIFSIAWGAVSAIVLFLGRIFLIVFHDSCIRLGRFLVEKLVYGKGFHRYSLDTYYQKVENLYNVFIQSSKISNPSVFISVIFVILAVVLWSILLKHKHLRYKIIIKPLFLFLILLDLFIFSSYGTGFRGNILDFDVLNPECERIYDIVTRDRGLFRILPYGIASGKLPNWAIPSANAIHGIDNIALYTPLANESFSIELRSLEIIDTALGLKLPEENSLTEQRDNIRLLNVKYVLSYKKLQEYFLNFILEDEGVFLYEAKDPLPRVFFSSTLDLGKMKSVVEVDIKEYDPGYMNCVLNAPSDGYLVFSENNYPGWVAFVDNEKSEILKIELVQAIRVKEGRHEIIFSYLSSHS